MFTLTLSREAEKQFVKLPKIEKKKVDKKLKILKNNPIVGKPLTGELKNFFSLKAWPCRIIYEFIKAEKHIKIYKI